MRKNKARFSKIGVFSLKRQKKFRFKLNKVEYDIKENAHKKRGMVHLEKKSE